MIIELLKPQAIRRGNVAHIVRTLETGFTSHATTFCGLRLDMHNLKPLTQHAEPWCIDCEARLLIEMAAENDAIIDQLRKLSMVH